MTVNFKNDYSEGAHPDILAALQRSNFEQHEGYAEDIYCQKAASLLKDHIDNPDADIHFVSGGTQANLIAIAAMLKPYESVIAADTGHINVHEAGAIESRGHKVNAIASSEGKLTCESIASVLKRHTDEHMVKPKMVYLSNATETGTIYNKTQLQSISVFCKSHDLYLYLDGARIGCALCASQNDLTLKEISDCVDVFYIGGTKNGALIGEALIINHNKFKENFRFYLKQNGALLAKSRLFGLQFYELFKNDLYFELADHANQMAGKLSGHMKKSGFSFLSQPQTNQIFPILPNALIEILSKQFAFYIWEEIDETSSAIRLVTSWATEPEAIDQFIATLNA
ncbi:MAG: aminotransferase class I/II-fold pyridoxal phosphate-dependent enzyme [Desulfobacula sp.]|nr:aminotransferase class I/II-fold pyridoxal phosphate-dependent enzyme [Desulfobacula sp.]